MILQQNYDNIAEDLRKAFRLYARRMLAYTVLDLVQRSKMHKQDKRVSAMCQRQDHHESMNSFQSVGEKSQFERSSEPESKKKTVKSIIFKDSLVDDAKQSQIDISQLYFGDKIMIARGGSQAIAQRIVLFTNQNSLSGIKFDDVRSNNINTKKCLFQIVQVDGLPRRPIIFGDIIALRNVWTGHYLSIQTDLIAHKCFGCRVVMKKNLEDDCHLRVGRVYDKLSQINQNNLVQTNSQVRLVLSTNPFYKLLIQKQRKMCLEEKQQYQLVASPSSEDLQLIKLNGDCNRSNNFLDSCQYYTVQNYQNLILSSIESRANPTARQKTLMIVIDGNQKTSFTYDNLSSGINQTQLALIPIENERPPLRAIWQVTKPKLLDPLNIYNDEQVILMNIVTREYLSLGSTNKKLKLSNEFSESFLFKVEGQQGSFQLKMGHQSYTAPINRRNVRQDRPTLLNSPLGRSEVSPHVQNNISCMLQLIDNSLFHDVKQFNDVLIQLLAIYEKVSIWGLTRNERGEIQYLYDRTLQEEHLLKYELDYFQNNLSLILNYISKANIVEFKLEDAQHFLRELGILEILIYFCRLFMSKSQSTIKSDIKTAFTVAKRNIQSTLLRTVDVIFRLIVDNRLSSDVLMQYANFFNVMLSSYPQEAGGLLHQAIRNLSILHTSYSDGQQLFQWVKLVDHATANNVSTQTKYLEILAEVLIDPKDKGILNYQNKCYQQLFSQRGRFKSKNKFVIFEISSSQPCILLYGVKNSDNKDMEEALVQERQSYCCISLEDLADLAKRNSTAKKFIEYTRTIVKLFRNMCKDRNKKLRIEVEDLGLTRNYIIVVVESPIIDHRTKMAFLDLYMEMYLDQDPFVPFNKAQKKCYVFDQLGRIDFRMKTSEIFKQYSETVDLVQVKYDFDCYIRCYMICCLEDTSRAFMQHTRPSPDEFILFSSLVKFLYSCANLGYFDIQFLCSSIGKVIEAAHCCLTIKQAQRKAHASFMDKLLIEVFKLLDLITSVQISIIILQNLVAIYRHYTQTGEDYNQKQIMVRCQQMLQGSIRMRHPSTTQEQLAIQKNKKFPTAVERLNSLQRRNYEKTIYPLQPAPESTTTDNPFMKMYSQVNNFLLMVVMQHPLDNNGEAFQMCLNLIQRRNSIHAEYCSIMKNIQIIVDADDERIYQQLAGGGPTQLLNINKLQLQTQKLTGQFAQVNGAQVRRTILLEISSLIKKLIKRLDIYELQSHLMFKKAQNIVSRLNVYSILRLIIRRCAGKQQFHELISTTYRFLTMFVRQNAQNSRQLVEDFEMFMAGLQYESMPTLLSTVFQQITKRQETFIMLLEASLTGANRMVAFQTIFKIVNSWGNPKLHELAYNFILYQPQNKPYLNVEVQAANVWFYRLLCHLVRIQPNRGICFREIYSRRELERRVQLSPYAVRSIYLQLLEVLYLSHIQNHVEVEFVVERLIVPVLRQAPRNLDGLTSHDYLKIFFKEDEGNLFEVERQQELVMRAHEVAQKLRAQFMNVEQDKKMKKKQSQLDPLEIQVGYWHYVWQFTSDNYSLFAWIKQKVENNSLPYMANLRSSLLRLRQMLQKMIVTTQEYTPILKQLDYLLAFSEDGVRQPVNTIGASSIFFNKLCDELIKCGISLNETFEMMGVESHLISGLMDVSVDRQEYQLPLHEFIKKFRKIKQEIERKHKNSDLDFNILRRFLSSLDCFQNLQFYFCQKVVEMMQQKKNSLLNTVYHDTKGQYLDGQSSTILLRSTTSKEFTTEIKSLNYVPTKFIKQNMMARHLEQMRHCLQKYYSQYKLRQMKQDFQSILDKKLHKDRRQKMMLHFGKMLSRFSHQEVPFILALMFIQRISLTQSTNRIQMTWDLKIPVNSRNNKAHLIIKLSEKIVKIFGYNCIEKQSEQLCHMVTDVIMMITRQLNTEITDRTVFKIENMIYDTIKLWKTCQDSKLGETIGNCLVMLLQQLLNNRQSVNFNKYHQISRCLLQFLQEGRLFLNAFVQKQQNQQLFSSLQMAICMDLYAVDKQHMQNIKLFDLLLQLLISHHTDGQEIGYLNYTHFNDLLEYNYQLYFKSRKLEIEQEIMCNHSTCNELRCQQGKLKPYDDFVFSFICKIMIIIQLASQSFKEIQNQEMLAFYQKFKGKIEIIDGQPRHIYYKIPFLRSYRNSTIKNTILQLVLRHPKQELYRHIHQISQIMHEELKAWKIYNKFLPSFLLNNKQRFLYILFSLVFFMNCLITVNIYNKRQHHPEATAMKAVIAILTIPQIVFAAIKVNTIRTVLTIDKSLSLKTRLFIINWAQLFSVLFQLLALYMLELYSIGCFLFALRVPAIEALYRPAIRQIQFLGRLLLYTVLFIISCVMLCSRKMGVTRPIDIILSFFWEYVEVVFYDQQMAKDGYFEAVGALFPIRVICDILLKIAAAMLLVGIVVDKWRQRRKREAYERYCLICLKQNEPSQVNNHIISSHNLWNYLDYFVYLEQKGDLTVMESRVKKWIDQKNWNFLLLR